VTAGVIQRRRALAARRRPGGSIDDVIQTDAALNPGKQRRAAGDLARRGRRHCDRDHSLCPGHLLSRSPSNTASFVLSELLRHGRVRAVHYIGIAGEQVAIARRLARHHGSRPGLGRARRSLEPAARRRAPACARTTSVVALDEAPVRGLDELLRRLTAERVGRACTVVALRAGERVTVELVPAERRPA
jgi:S1-C subfamily serine protease